MPSRTTWRPLPVGALGCPEIVSVGGRVTTGVPVSASTLARRLFARILAGLLARLFAGLLARLLAGLFARLLGGLLAGLLGARLFARLLAGLFAGLLGRLLAGLRRWPRGRRRCAIRLRRPSFDDRVVGVESACLAGVTVVAVDDRRCRCRWEPSTVTSPANVDRERSGPVAVVGLACWTKCHEDLACVEVAGQSGSV